MWQRSNARRTNSEHIHNAASADDNDAAADDDNAADNDDNAADDDDNAADDNDDNTHAKRSFTRPLPQRQRTSRWWSEGSARSGTVKHPDTAAVNVSDQPSEANSDV